MLPSLFPAARDVLWGGLVLLLLFAPHAHAQAPSCPELAEAQQRYDNGRFEEAIEIATRCLESEAGTAAERQRAYRLVGLSYIGQDLRDNARDAVRQLVELVPNFEPDPVNDPPQFIQMVEEAKAEEAQRAADEAANEEVPIVDPERRAEEERLAEEARQAEEARRAAEEARRAEAARRQRDSGGGITKWLLIGGAVVGGGALAAVLLSGGDDGGGGGGIPTPPLPPGQ